MILSAACWVCEGRGERQVAVKSGGTSDGRTLCRVCLRRLIEWLGGAPGLSARHGAVWLGAAGSDASEAELRSLVVRLVAESPEGADDASRVAVAIAYLEMGLVDDALAALGRVDPASAQADALTERALTSLLSRLFAPSALVTGARDQLRAALYPLG